MAGNDQQQWPKGMVELADIMESAFTKHGRAPQEACELAEIAIRAMAFLAGGRTFYLPSGRKLKTAIKHRRIFQEFTGSNVAELARKHELTEVQIYSIIKQQRGLTAGHAGQ